VPPVHGHDARRGGLCRFEQSRGAIPRMLNLSHSEVVIMTPGLVRLVAAITLGVMAGSDFRATSFSATHKGASIMPNTQNIVLLSAIGLLVMVSALAYWVS
jgi:hypothetical protein